MTEELRPDKEEALPLRDVVFRTLRQAILRNELKPGERLMEIPLAKKLRVSRTPVREAIRMLELEGLVTTSPRRGAVVADITLTDLEDVLEVRLALEELAVRLVCRKRTNEQLANLRRLADAFQDSLRGEDVEACAQADMAFHDAICNATGNRRLIQILNNLREQMYRYRMEYLKDTKFHAALAAEHEEILDAIRERDEKRAVASMQLHINRQREYISARISKKEEEKN